MLQCLVEKEPPGMPDRSREAVETLEACLLAEAEFFSSVHEKLDETQRDELLVLLRHENTFHVARIFYLLKAFNCTTADALERFLKNHNNDIRSEIEASAEDAKRIRELKKAAFNAQRVFKLKAYFEQVGGPAFGVTDLADLLFGQIKRTSAINYIETLRLAGFVEKRMIELDYGAAEDPLADGAQNSAEVIVSTEVLEDLYGRYLLDIRDGILSSDGQPTLREVGRGAT